MPLSKSACLDQVLGLLTPRSWVKGTYRRFKTGTFEEEQWCLVGAVRHVLRQEHLIEDATTHDLYRDLSVMFRAQCPDIYDRVIVHPLLDPGEELTIPTYNDADEMDYPTLIAVVEKTRNALAERGE